MKEFKFGDKVRFKATGQIGVVVGEATETTMMVIQFDDGETGYVPPSSFSDFELIPHPDTARLEWLAASGGEIRRLDNGRWCIKHYVPARPVMGIAETSGHTLRTVIDAAMQQSALPETQP